MLEVLWIVLWRSSGTVESVEETADVNFSVGVASCG